MSTKQRLVEGDSAYRKMFPMAEGLLDYFPDALAAVSNLSYLGNLKHNISGAPRHERTKSMDHADCIMRHLTERGGFDIITVDGMDYRVRHSVALAWRALALAQQEIEEAEDLPLPRGARP
jgi:hypothetical protein